MEEKERLKNKYEELGRLLGMLPVLSQDSMEIDYEDMNKWLNHVLEFYESFGRELSFADFRNIFTENSTNYLKMNKVVNGYMFIFFNHRNDLDNSKFWDYLLRLEDSTASDKINPVIDEIVAAVNMINAKNMDIFNQVFADLNARYKDLDLGKIDFTTIDCLKKEVRRRIEKLYNEIEQEKIMGSLQSDFGSRFRIFCNRITLGKFANMTDGEKSEFFSQLPRIVDIIIKLRLFDNVRSDYLKYSREHDYNGVMKTINDAYYSRVTLQAELDQEIHQRGDLTRRRFVFNKANEIRKQEKRIFYLTRQILDKSGEIDKATRRYIQGFISRYNMKAVTKKFLIYGLEDTDKLFGVFDIDMLPIDSEKVNAMPIFVKNGVKIPPLNSSEFLEVSKLALELTQGNVSIDTTYYEVTSPLNVRKKRQPKKG